MVEKSVNNSQSIEVIEKSGKTKFKGMHDYKSFRTWISSRIQVASRKQNKEYEMIFMQILNAYNYFHSPQERTESTHSGMGKIIDEKIRISGIHRENWNAVFGNSLANEILKIRSEGFDQEQCYAKIIRDQCILELIGKFPQEKYKIFDKIKTSVWARYGENNSSERLKENALKVKGGAMGED